MRTKNDDPAAKHEHPFRTPGKPTDEPLEGGDELLLVAAAEVEDELRAILLPTV